jgi:hypothetical protein
LGAATIIEYPALCRWQHCSSVDVLILFFSFNYGRKQDQLAQTSLFYYLYSRLPLPGYYIFHFSVYLSAVR